MKNIVNKTILIGCLLLTWKYLPVFETKGVFYLLSLLTLLVISREVFELYKTLKISPEQKKHLFSITYQIILIGLLVIGILFIPKLNPAGNQRYIRLLMISVILFKLSKLTQYIVKESQLSLIKNTMLVVFSTCTFILLIESIFMFISLSHGGGEAYSGKIWGNRYWNKINSFGYRDDEPLNKKNTVLFVGDSFTAGWGVKNTEDRFSDQTEINSQKNGTHINAINIGRYGADTKLEYSLTTKFIKKSKIKPKKIVLQYFVNDVDKIIPSNNKCKTKPTSESNLKKLMIEGSYLFNYINALYPSSNSIKLPIECDYVDGLKNVYTIDSLWEKEKYELNKFTNYCAKQKIELILILFPFMEDINLSKKINIDNRIETYCKNNGIQLLNVSKYIKHLKQNERQVSIVDSHASAEVHKIVGEKLSTLIKKTKNGLKKN